jgi:hypothetical protein
MRPEDLPLEDRLKVAAIASRFFECLVARRRQDAAIIASFERSLCDPDIRARINQLLSPKGTSDAIRGDSSRRQNNIA